jgi:hypothetical protein
MCGLSLIVRFRILTVGFHGCGFPLILTHKRGLSPAATMGYGVEKWQ